MQVSRLFPEMAGYTRGAFSRDLMASLVVFLVAVPLGLGIALASGAPLISGIIACAVGGIVAGFLAGAPLQVTGPAAGLTLLTYGIIQQFGWSLSLTIFALSGVLQIGLGMLGIGRTCLMISPAVVKGMLAGIGVVIALAQLHVLLGGQPQSSAVKNILELPGQVSALNGHAAITGLITLVILVGWDYMPAKVKLIPGALVAIVTATILSTAIWPDVSKITLPEQLLVFQAPALPEGAQWTAFVVAAVSVALVASVESLLCAVATDKLHNGMRAKLNRELIAQGTANVVSGSLGGLPVTGVIVRSSANIQGGAVTRVSAILHGVWIIVFIALFAGIVRLIPLPALAGLLVYVGVKLVNWQHIRELKSHREELIYAATLLGVVTIGLLQGVGIGIALAFILLFRRLSQVDISKAEHNGNTDIRIDGSLTFLNVPRLTAALADVKPGRDVYIDLDAHYMDHAAFETLHSWKKSYELSGGKVEIDELHHNWYSSAADGQPIVVPPNKGRYALASILNNGHEDEPHDLLQGVTRFKRSLGEALRPLYSKLGTEGQRPVTLFITCCDSRIDPAFITAARPGELFVLRNIGNMVPDPTVPTNTDISVKATLEYAINILKVKHIVVCGHSDCGAMKALLDGSFKKLDGINDWLKDSHANLPKDVCHVHHDKPENVVSRWNVAEQLRHLTSYSHVSNKVNAGELEIHGWFFEIETADVYRFDAERECWTDMVAARQCAPIELKESPAA